MAEDRRGQRPSRGGSGAGRSSAGRGGATGGRGGSSSRSDDSRGRGGSSRGDAPRGGARGAGGKGGAPTRGGNKAASGKTGGRGGQDRAFRGRAEPKIRTADQAEYDGPPLPEHVTGAELDRGVRAQLKGLPEKLAARVARHLAAAGVLIDEDPELAYRHTLAARARASRLAVVREATGEAAYAAGHYDVALAELRAAKRMNGATDYLPIMADCHRALGNPEQAIKLAKSPSVANFSTEAKAEMTLVEAGARRDMGQLDAALRTLELAPLTSKSRQPWVVRLRYAYADTLEAAGREADALAWFHRTHAIDSEELTDAAGRADALESRQA
ncbi:tetratricopeptide repeat protein [Nocardioides KLBMP 9356]|uniref:Tetratricopeptide repeat protein n=1 Tax=Nocardioides potassii TaxID=2911371 RepID=A0ABS9HFE3_9ACTN|nr:tetratricopeptide repeat protein [Nocardioides potassii]MCF6379154.1 tetratricopeptide repeat protein [Nocardioides potassii]